MHKIIPVAATVLAAALLVAPVTAQARDYDRHDDRHHNKGHRDHKYQRHHDNRRYDHHRGHRTSFSYGWGYPGYIRYRAWPVNVHLDLNHHRDRKEVVIVERTVATNNTTSYGSELFIYPRNGQSSSERDQDRYECHVWSRNQTGFDPSRSNSNRSMAPDYSRAMAACLEGRGYTVK